jgi:hypothetical protein
MQMKANEKKTERERKRKKVKVQGAILLTFMEILYI